MLTFEEKNLIGLQRVNEAIAEMDKHEAERVKRMIEFCNQPIGDEDAINLAKAD